MQRHAALHLDDERTWRATFCLSTPCSSSTCWLMAPRACSISVTFILRRSLYRCWACLFCSCCLGVRLVLLRVPAHTRTQMIKDADWLSFLLCSRCRVRSWSCSESLHQLSQTRTCTMQIVVTLAMMCSWSCSEPVQTRNGDVRCRVHTVQVVVPLQLLFYCALCLAQLPYTNRDKDLRNEGFML